MSSEHLPRFNDLDQVMEQRSQRGFIFGRGHVGDLKRLDQDFFGEADFFNVDVEEDLYTDVSGLVEIEEQPLAQKSVDELLAFCRTHPDKIAALTGFMTDELSQCNIKQQLENALDSMQDRFYSVALQYVDECFALVRLVNFQKKYVVQFLDGLAELIEEGVGAIADITAIQKQVANLTQEIARIEQEALESVPAAQQIQASALRELGS